MTIPKDVQEAVRNVAQSLRDTFIEDDIVHEQVSEIRAHLISQDAEIARLESQRESVERDCRDYRQIQIEDSARAELAESRLAAANALLCEAIQWNWLDDAGPLIWKRLTSASNPTCKELAMKLRTEMVAPDSTNAGPYPAARSDDDGQDYLHDAAAAHALKQAIDTLSSRGPFVEPSDWVYAESERLLREWGFDSGEVE